MMDAYLKNELRFENHCYDGKKYFLIVACIFFLNAAKAQPPDLMFSRSLDKIQLSGDNCTCIAQDSTGAIWIGTDRGLNIYNGYTTKSYFTRIGDTASLPNNTINDMEVTATGEVWVGTYSGVCVYNRDFDNFNRLASDENYAGLKNLYITAINQGNDGNIYVSASNILYRYNRQMARFDSLFQLKSGIIYDFKISASNDFWMGTSENGVAYFNPFSGKTVTYSEINGDSASLSNNVVQSVALMGDSLWIATYGGGINLLSIQTGKVKRFRPADNYAAYSFYTYIDRSRNLWTCDLTGIKFFSKSDQNFYGYYTVKGDNYSVKNSARAIIEDRQGNYWTIHRPGGPGVSFAPKGFTVFDNRQGKFWRLDEMNVKSIESDSKGNWWMGNGFNGIDIFDYSAGIVKTYHYDKDDRFSLGQGGTECIFRDSDGRMWIGTNLGGLQYFDDKSGRFYTFTNNPSDSNSIANNDIRSIAEDKEGNLWIVTHGKGIDRFDKRKQVFTHYSTLGNNLSNDWVFQVVFDHQENLWAASAWGLSKLKKGSSEFETFLMGVNDSTSLCSNLVNCLYSDSQGRLWIGTSGGLNLWLPEKNCFRKVEQGFQSNNINAITEGGGYIWASSPRGISRINPETFEVFNFDEDDGLLKEGFHPRSVSKSGGQILFGGANGMVAFNPDEINLNSQIPEIYLTELKINYEPIVSYGEGSVLKEHISQTKELKLSHKQNTIEIEFIANNLINPQRNKFRYKMKGVSDKWVDTGTENKALFTNLPPGRYTLTVTGSNNDNVWNEKGISLRIRILHPWWSTWVAYFFYGLGIIILIYFIITRRTSVLERQRNELEKKVEERTRELNLNNEQLEKQSSELAAINEMLTRRQEIIESQAEEMKVAAENLEEANQKLRESNSTKDKLFSIIAHDLKNPFNVILGYTELLIENDDEWGKEEKLNVVRYMSDSSSRAYNLLENLLHWSGSQSGSLEFWPVETRAADMIQQAINETRSFADKKKIEVENLLMEEETMVYADLNMLSLILRNLIMNAVKFSHPDSRVLINVQDYDKHYILFSVKDFGIGMDSEKSATLFESGTNTSSTGTQGEKGTGLGLLLCSEFVSKHQGKIWVESKPGEGTVIYFTIPRPPE